MSWLAALGFLLVAAAAATIALIITSAVQRPTRPQRYSWFSASAASTEFLFDGETLVDSSPSARQLLLSSPVLGGSWVRLISYLAPMFPNIDERIAALANSGPLSLCAATPKGRNLLLTAEYIGGLTRISLRDPARDLTPPPIDPLVYQAMTDELQQLRDALVHSPMLIWRETAEGQVVWANASYLLKATAALPAGQHPGWPLPRLFDLPADQQSAKSQRAALHLAEGKDQWFDLMPLAIKNQRLIYALPADTVVGAETALREFMQTLTKTFAGLPIGLAIFDHNRQLQLFNPALLDLTGLPADLLTSRPSLLAVLDGMRDRNMLPEPKDYRGWRRQLVDMEKAAALGQYEETWNLPDGQTYKVIGRPHPNGALALMIQDITNEVSRTRRYRLDLDLSQAVIDEVDEAIAVFSPSGQLVMSNIAYAALWDHGSEIGLGNQTARTEALYWRSKTPPSALWGEAEEFISTVGNLVAWNAETRLLDGRRLACRFAPLTGGSRLAGFRVIATAEAALGPSAIEGINLKTA